MSFIVLETPYNQMVNSRFIKNAGYKLVDIMSSGETVKHVYAWDSEYGVYLYWDSDFIENLEGLGRQFHISGLVWDSNIGLVWFDSEASPTYGVLNLNQIFQDESFNLDIEKVDNVIKYLTEEEQALLCLTLPWMSGFFSSIQRVIRLASGVELL